MEKQKKSLPRRMLANALLLSLLGTCLPVIAGGQSSITNTVSYEYDALGNQTKKIVEPNIPQLRVETTNTFNGSGLVVKSVTSSPAVGNAAIAPRTTTQTYGAPMRYSTNALGQQTVMKVDYNYGRLLERKAPDGTLTTWRQDTFGRPQQEVKPDGSATITSFRYCAGIANGTSVCPALAAYVSETQSFVSPSGPLQPISPWERKYFDSLDRLIRTETQGFDGTSVIRVDSEYDAFGRLYRTSRPYYSGQAIYWTTYEYDELDRVTRVTSTDGAVVTTSRSGLVTTVTNALNQTKVTIANSAGQPVAVRDALNNVLSYTYDPNGNLVKTVDPAGNTILLAYDILNRQISNTDPDRGTTTYEYDVLGQLKKQTDQRGKVATFAYNLLGRMTSRVEEDLVSTWTYGERSEADRLRSVTTDNGYLRNLIYDSIGRVRQESYHDGFYLTPTYDATSKRVTTVLMGVAALATNVKLKYNYTPLGYLSEVRDDATGALIWRADAMDAEGHLTQQTYGNNVVTQNVFDPATGRLKNIYAGPGNAVQDMSFEYDQLGNMLWRVDATQSLSETFEYDSLNRLTANTVNSPSAPLQTQSYSYDSIGNITSRSDQGSYAYGTNGAGPHAVSQITQAGGAIRQLSYDAIGGMVLDQTRDAGGAIIAAKTRNISYTSFGMPSTITANGTSATFLYGPDHQRIKQTTPTGNTVYIHPDNAGGLGYERETRVDGTVEHRYFVSANGIPVALIKKMATTANTAITSTTTSYLHRDHLGSTSAVTDGAGVVVERMAYEPFGKRRVPAGQVDPNNRITASTTDRGFTTHEHLDELGLIHMNGRVYDPLIARFMSADPTNANPDDIASYNRYSYVHNNPLGATDPSGYVRCMAGVIDDAIRCGEWLTNALEGASSYVKEGYDLLAKNFKAAPLSGTWYANVNESISQANAARNEVIRGATLSSPNPYVAQSAACVGREGACVAAGTAVLGGGWLASTKLGQAALAFFGFGGEVQGLAEGVPSGRGVAGAEVKTAMEEAAKSYTAAEIRALVNAASTRFGSSGQAYNVKTENELVSLFEQLSKGGNQLDAKYLGTMKGLPDGTIVGLREVSSTGGKTIDVFPAGGKPYKIHIQP